MCQAELAVLTFEKCQKCELNACGETMSVTGMAARKIATMSQMNNKQTVRHNCKPSLGLQQVSSSVESGGFKQVMIVFEMFGSSRMHILSMDLKSQLQIV